MSVFGPINTFELQLDRIAKMSGRVQPPRCKTLRNRYPGVKGAAPEPSVTTLDDTKDWALLQCAVKGASPQPKVEWKDSAGNILPAKEHQVTERRGSYDITLNITVTKTDRYRCVVTQEEINHQIFAETSVYIQGAATKPNVEILDQTTQWALLQCAVEGVSPQPKVEWKDSAGNILHAKEPQVTERGGSYHVILNITVTKTDRYQCVVTQEEINHHISAETYVLFSEAQPQTADSTGWIVGFVLGALLTLLLVGGGYLFVKRPKNKETNNGVANGSTPTEEPNSLTSLRKLADPES